MAKKELDILFFQWVEQPEKLIQLSRSRMRNDDLRAAGSSLKVAQQQASHYSIIEFYKLVSLNVHRIDILHIFGKVVKPQPEAHFSGHLFADLLFKENKLSERTL